MKEIINSIVIHHDYVKYLPHVVAYFFEPFLLTDAV